MMVQITTLPSIQVTRPVANRKIKFIVGGLLIALAVVYLIYTGIQSN